VSASQESVQRRRAERAQAGSNRKRDLEAASQERVKKLQARRQMLRAETRETEAACFAWGATLGHMALSVPESTFDIWIEPLCLAGEVRGSLHIEAPAMLASWVDRRYSSLLGECVRAHSDLKGVHISAAQVEVDF